MLGGLLGAARRSSGGSAWQPPSPEDLQLSFGEYEIRDILGRGGMGAVYKAWHKRLERFVAIKILPSQIDDGGMNFAERFKREAAAMAKFSHPAIVAVHDAGETRDGLLYFTMELMEGTDVAQLVARQGRLPVAQALAIASRVCEALVYSHERGVIHRDIKPSNVMIEADGTVKVADFGLAKLPGDDKHVTTGSGLSIGTPDFMPPEALHGSRRVDHRGDIYATGGLLYQMLTGNVPHGRFVPPSLVVAGLDKRLDGIVDKAMNADPGKRHATAGELLADLARVAATLKKPAKGGTQTAGEPHRRSVAKLALVAAVVAVVLGIAAISSGLWKPQPDGNASAPGSTAWRDGLAELPMEEVIAKAVRTAQGWQLPDHNHWLVSPRAQRSGAVRVRASGVNAQFISLYVDFGDGQGERLRFRPLSKEWKLSHGPLGVDESDFASTTGAFPLDGKPHDLLFARIGGRLRATFDGQLLFDEADPSPTPGRFGLEVYRRASVWVEKVENLELDDVPEAEALKLLE
jgi:serine/threonine protein kinase